MGVATGALIVTTRRMFPQESILGRDGDLGREVGRGSECWSGKSPSWAKPRQDTSLTSLNQIGKG